MPVHARAIAHFSGNSVPVIGNAGFMTSLCIDGRSLMKGSKFFAFS